MLNRRTFVGGLLAAVPTMALGRPAAGLGQEVAVEVEVQFARACDGFLAGDIAVLFVATEGEPIEPPRGWNLLGTEARDGITSQAFERTFDGTETALPALRSDVASHVVGPLRLGPRLVR